MTDDHINLSRMNFDVSEEQTEILNMVDRACNEIRDYEAECWLKHKLNDRIVPVFGKAHLLGLPISSRYGDGQGVDPVTYVMAMERIGMEGSSLRTFFSGHISIGQLTVEHWGNEEQRERYLPKTTRGENLMAFALTEPEAGSDPGALRMTYEKKGNHYILNGTKSWISNATIADVVTAYAREKTTGKISAFIVEKASDGYSIEHQREKIGLLSADTGIIYLDSCPVPKENLLAEEGMGMHVAYDTIMNGRLSVAAGAIGEMQDSLNESIIYAKQRVQHGKQIGKHQLIQEHLSRMAINLDAARYFVYRAADAMRIFNDERSNIRKRDYADILIAKAKYFAANACFDTTWRAVQVFGGNGYSTEYRVARHFCDSRVSQIYEGINEILLLKIGASLLGKGYEAYR